GVGICTHRLAPKLQGDAALETRNLPEWRVALNCAEHITPGIFTEMEFALRGIGPRDHQVFRAKLRQSLILGCGAAGDLDSKLTEQFGEHAISVGVAARKFDRHATEYHNTNPE